MPNSPALSLDGFSRRDYLNSQLSNVFEGISSLGTKSGEKACLEVMYSDDPLEHAMAHLWIGGKQLGAYVPTPIFCLDVPQLRLSSGSLFLHRSLRFPPLGATLYRLFMRVGGSWADERARIVNDLADLFETRLAECGYKVEMEPTVAPRWLKDRMAAERRRKDAFVG